MSQLRWQGLYIGNQLNRFKDIKYQIELISLIYCNVTTGGIGVEEFSSVSRRPIMFVSEATVIW